jgi:hypothetical protein
VTSTFRRASRNNIDSTTLFGSIALTYRKLASPYQKIIVRLENPPHARFPSRGVECGSRTVLSAFVPGQKLSRVASKSSRSFGKLGDSSSRLHDRQSAREAWRLSPTCDLDITGYTRSGLCIDPPTAFPNGSFCFRVPSLKKYTLNLNSDTLTTTRT